jgi:hypothetical protein
MNYFEIADYNPIRSDFKIPKDFEPIRRYQPNVVLTDKAINKLTKLGFVLREIQMFSTLPRTVTKIHIDGNSFASKSAINYVVNGIGSMNWYRLLNSNTKYSVTEAGTGYMPFNVNDCEKIDSVNLNKLTLVEVCVPHNIVNDSDEYRYCFSIRYHDNNFDNTFKRLEAWNNLVN